MSTHCFRGQISAELLPSLLFKLKTLEFEKFKAQILSEAVAVEFLPLPPQQNSRSFGEV